MGSYVFTKISHKSLSRPVLIMDGLWRYVVLLLFSLTTPSVPDVRKRMVHQYDRQRVGEKALVINMGVLFLFIKTASCIAGEDQMELRAGGCCYTCNLLIWFIKVDTCAKYLGSDVIPVIKPVFCYNYLLSQEESPSDGGYMRWF